MVPNRAPVWLVVALVAVAAERSGAADPQMVRDAIAKAAEAAKTGSRAEADKAYVEALAHAAGDAELESEGALAGAINLDQWYGAKPDDVTDDQRARMIRWYELTRDQGSETQ